MNNSARRALAMFSGMLMFGALAVARPDSGYHLLNTYKFGAAPGSTGEYFDYVTVRMPRPAASTRREARPCK